MSLADGAPNSSLGRISSYIYLFFNLCSWEAFDICVSEEVRPAKLDMDGSSHPAALVM